jgi:hypothetical protein
MMVYGRMRIDFMRPHVRFSRKTQNIALVLKSAFIGKIGPIG